MLKLLFLTPFQCNKLLSFIESNTLFLKKQNIKNTYIPDYTPLCYVNIQKMPYFHVLMHLLKDTLSTSHIDTNKAYTPFKHIGFPNKLTTPFFMFYSKYKTWLMDPFFESILKRHTPSKTEPKQEHLCSIARNKFYHWQTV